MGHADVSTTLNIYAEASDTAKLQAVNNMQKIFDIFQNGFYRRWKIKIDIKLLKRHQFDIKLMGFDGQIWIMLKSIK